MTAPLRVRACAIAAHVAGPGNVPYHPPPERGAGGRDALVDWGLAPAAIAHLATLGLGFR